MSSKRDGTSVTSNESCKSKESELDNSLWYPWNDNEKQSITKSQIKEIIDRVIHEQKVGYETMIIKMRNEIIELRNEVLSLKGSQLKLTEDYLKIKPIIDERKRNQLLRMNIPFGFIPDKEPKSSTTF